MTSAPETEAEVTMTNDPMKDFYTPKDVAAHFGVTPKTARRAMRKEGIRCGSGSRHIFTKARYEEVIRQISKHFHQGSIQAGGPEAEGPLTAPQAALEAEPVPESEEAAMTNEETRSNLKDSIKKRSTWLRGLYMLLFMIVWGLAELLVFTVIVFQFISMALSGKTNGRLLTFGRNLSAFVYEILMYLTYNREDKPFPFSDWPSLKDPTDAADGDGQTTRTG